MSVNPSSSLGCRYLDAYPVNAILGRMLRFSGLVCTQLAPAVLRLEACIEGSGTIFREPSTPSTLLAWAAWLFGARSGVGTCTVPLALQLTSGLRFNARTVSLCSHTLAGAVKWMHRIGTFLSLARLTHTARVSASAFVLSGGLISFLFPCRRWRAGFRDDLPTSTLVPCSTRAVAALMHFSRCFKALLKRRTTRAVLQHSRLSTYCLQYVLVHPRIAKWLEVLPVIRRLASARAAARNHNILCVGFREYGDFSYS